MEWVREHDQELNARWNRGDGFVTKEWLKNEIFGIHSLKAEQAGYFILIHLPSNKVIRRDYPSEEAAVMAADLLVSQGEEFGVDWYSTDLYQGLVYSRRRIMDATAGYTAAPKVIETPEEEQEEETEDGEETEEE